MTIYEKNIGGLVKTGDRSIVNFPSGLVRIDQLYIGKTGEEATHRAALGYEMPMPNQPDAPVIDGLFIFPEVQESKDGTGFTRYQCSAYGRSTDTYRELTRTQNKFIANEPAPGTEEPEFNTRLDVVAYNMTGTIVKPRGEVIEDGEITFDDDFLMLRSVQLRAYPFIPTISVVEINANNRFPITREYLAKFDTAQAELQEVTFSVTDPFITVTAQRNFGKFVEYEFNAVRQPQNNLEV